MLCAGNCTADLYRDDHVQLHVADRPVLSPRGSDPGGACEAPTRRGSRRVGAVGAVGPAVRAVPGDRPPVPHRVHQFHRFVWAWLVTGVHRWAVAQSDVRMPWFLLGVGADGGAPAWPGG